METGPPTRRTEVLVVLWVVVFLGWPLFLGLDRFVTILFDDSFYYAQIARNAAAGHGLTFDGLHATTGYQPLWQWILVVVVGLIPGDLAPIKAILALEVLLTATAALGLLRALAPRVGRTPALAAALLLATQPGAVGTLCSGMESALMLATFVAGWRAWLVVATAPETARARDWMRLGVLCALTMLARLEAGALLLVIALVEGRRLLVAPRRAAQLVLPAALALGAVLAWNHARVGLWFPVSGVIKARNAQRHASVRLPWNVPWIGQQALVAALGRTGPEAWSRAVRLVWEGGLVALAVTVVAWRRAVRAALARAGVTVPLAAAALIVLLDKLVVEWIAPWERTPLLLANCLVLAAALAGRPRLTRVGLVVVLLASAATVRNTVDNAEDPTLQYGYYRIAAARWLRAHTAEDERAGSWSAGQVAWFSHRPVVNLDGLVNDGEFYRRVIVGHALAAYLAEQHIARLVDQRCGAPTSISLIAVAPDGPAIAAAYPTEWALYNERTPDRCPGEFIWRRRGAAPSAARR